MIKSNRFRQLSTFFIIVLLTVSALGFSLAAEPDHIEIHFIDVGMGDAILLRSFFDGVESDMMIDTGDRNHTVSVTDYLLSRHVKELKYLVLTHPHADHIGGANRILNNFTVDEMVLAPLETDTATYVALMEKIEKLRIPTVYPQVGETLSFGNAQLELLAPAPVLYSEENDWSLVYMLTYAGKRVLFTGDAEYASEQDMIASGFDLQADVLKVGHHGSHTSTCYDFALAVSPTYAVISCGTTKSKEYPDTEVGMNIMDAGASDILTTLTSGTIVLTITPNGELQFATEK